MNAAFFKTAIFSTTLYLVSVVVAHAQAEDQSDLFQKYQAMVIIEEANQHCPLLSRLEAEVLNGQIVFANSTFSGKLDAVEKFKKEARIFARRSACDAPELMGLIGVARQEASDSMVNHLLLARQIHLLDQQAVKDGEITGILLLNYLQDEEWALIDNLYEEVKRNYLSQATEEDWEKFLESIVNVADEKTAQTYLSNEKLMTTRAAESFDAIQAKANNREITSYYYNLEKSVRAFVEGADAVKTGYPYSRPSNDFTNWTAYRPRDEKEINWVLSYPGCGGKFDGFFCTLFASAQGDIGVVVDGEIEKITLEYRDPEDKQLAMSNKTVEGPIGSNELHEKNLHANLTSMTSSAARKIVQAMLSSDHDNYLSQSGSVRSENSRVYIFPKETLPALEVLGKNDLLKLIITKNGDVEQEGVIPLHNYRRAKNWAYSIQ
jgi:hypothetical protein|tara:strand:+ start:53453 stop:54757 length:1305 start_codon:yes stop_codon:yes gene_type:complete